MTKRILILLISAWVISIPAFSQVLVHTTAVKCHGEDNGKARLSISNAPGPYKITWKKGATEITDHKNKTTADNLPAGAYTVEITDVNDCMIEREFIIESAPELNLVIVSTTGSFDYCGSKSFPDVTLNGFFSGGKEPIACSNGCQQKVTGPGEYSFTIIDANGCQKTESVRVNWIGIVCSFDPNDITGPAGYNEPRWVAASKPMEYTIRFENDPEFATSPAQRVHVELPFHPEINPFSLRLGSFGFGEHVFTLPFTQTYYQERLDLQSEIGLYIDVVAGLDVNENKAFWTFQSIDPLTGLPPANPLIGFLPVNDTLTGSGEGFVTFTLLPKPSATTGDTVAATAGIVFDANEEIITNTWVNTLDALAPSSVLEPLDSITENPLIILEWTGNDDPGGCGVRDYAVYYQIDGGPFLVAGDKLEGDTLHFTAVPGHSYGFYVSATDTVGNKEIKTTAESTIMVADEENITVRYPFADPQCVYDSISIAWNSASIDSIRILMSLDSGYTYFPLASSLYPTDSLLSIYLADSMITDFARIRFQSLEDTTLITHSLFFPIKPLPVIAADGDEHTCLNTPADLLASGGNTYQWSPGYSLYDSTAAYTAAYIDTNTLFYLTGTDVFGCRNRDSILINVHPIYLDTILHEMCNENSVFVGGGYQTEPGYYVDSLLSVRGCDSTVITHVVLTGPCAFPADQVYVDKDATGLNNGTSWANAFTDLQDALEAVEYYENVTDIWIAEGQYSPSIPGGRDGTFTLRDSVKMFGGFSGTETTLEDRTGTPLTVKITGDIGILSDSTDNVFHVISVDSSCVDCQINFLTIQLGQGNGVGPQTLGAGIYSNGSLLIDQLILERNTTTDEGAAIYNAGPGHTLRIKDCLFRLNYSSLARDIMNTNGAELRFEGINTIED